MKLVLLEPHGKSIFGFSKARLIPEKAFVNGVMNLSLIDRKLRSFGSLTCNSCATFVEELRSKPFSNGSHRTARESMFLRAVLKHSGGGKRALTVL
jgi:hypothetical protein